MKFLLYSCLSFVVLIAVLVIGGGIFLKTLESKVVYVTSSSLNLREEPSTTSKVLTVLQKGDRLSKVKTVDEWSLVKSKKFEGWVHTSFISTDIQQIPHKVISQKVHRKVGTNHLYIDTKIKVRASKEELRSLAHYLKKKAGGKPYRTWIFHYLEGDSDKVPWATTHWDPDLEVTILGATQKQDEMLTRTAGEGLDDIFGLWRSGGEKGDSVTTFYIKSGKMMCRRMYSDASFSDESLSKDGNKYWTDNTHGEYYRIENDGSLGHYGPSGRFNISKKITRAPLL